MKPLISVQVASSMDGSQFGIATPLLSRHSQPPGKTIGTEIEFEPSTKLSIAVRVRFGAVVTGSSKVAVMVTRESAVTTSRV